MKEEGLLGESLMIVSVVLTDDAWSQSPLILGVGPRPPTSIVDTYRPRRKENRQITHSGCRKKGLCL